jgi:hypothetical protein
MYRNSTLEGDTIVTDQVLVSESAACCAFK